MHSRSTEYALRAVIALAEQGERPRSTAALAARTRVPAGYLSKVLQMLARAGLVHSTAGRTGGFQLTRPSQDLAVLDVVNAIAPVARIHSCPLGNPSHTDLCPLHRRLDQIAEWTENAFREITIAQLLQSGPASRALCDPIACIDRSRQDSRRRRRTANVAPRGRRERSRSRRPRG
jgi:Rrf2 family protein